MSKIWIVLIVIAFIAIVATCVIITRKGSALQAGEKGHNAGAYFNLPFNYATAKNN